ncbi:MAG: endo-1,4-beta-xylanase, partial [Treponema sp.]|nr:endo-1,4-beta-xylanase [Treponema sp.]
CECGEVIFFNLATDTAFQTADRTDLVSTALEPHGPVTVTVHVSESRNFLHVGGRTEDEHGIDVVGTTAGYTIRVTGRAGPNWPTANRAMEISGALPTVGAGWWSVPIIPGGTFTIHGIVNNPADVRITGNSWGGVSAADMDFYIYSIIVGRNLDLVDAGGIVRQAEGFWPPANDGLPLPETVQPAPPRSSDTLFDLAWDVLQGLSVGVNDPEIIFPSPHLQNAGGIANVTFEVVSRPIAGGAGTQRNLLRVTATSGWAGFDLNHAAFGFMDGDVVRLAGIALTDAQILLNTYHNGIRPLGGYMPLVQAGETFAIEHTLTQADVDAIVATFPQAIRIRAYHNNTTFIVTDLTVVRPGGSPAAVLPSLRMIWGETFPIFGNIVAYNHHRRHSDIRATTGTIVTTPERAAARGALLTRHFNLLVAEDEMKPDAIFWNPAWNDFPELPQWNFGPMNQIMSFAQTNNMGLHGHALAWHGQTPEWMFAGKTRANSAQARYNLVRYIETVMRHGGTRVQSWDVLNEVIWSSVPGSATVTAANWRNFLRGNPGPGAPWENTSGWFSSIGSSANDPDNNCFIWIAFTTARRVADEIDAAAGRPPGTMILYYNDYNEEQPSKRMAIYHMVREMNERFYTTPPAGFQTGRILIDAIGMQAHYHIGDSGSAYSWPTNISNVEASIVRFASLIGQGLLRYVSITELDVTVGHTGNDEAGNINRPLGTPPTPAQLRQQAIMYARLFHIFRTHSANLRRVSLWGIDDPGSWRHRGSPHLWDGNLAAKEAFWAVAAPDAFVNPATGLARPAAEIDAFLADPRSGTYIPEQAWN